MAPLSRHEHVRSVVQGTPSDGAVPVEATVDSLLDDGAEGELLFEYDSGAVYRLERPVGRACACEQVEQHGCPVRDARAEDGEVVFRFIVPDLETLRDVVDDLRTEQSSVTVRCLLRSGTADAGSEPVFVDRGKLTDRQREVLRTAHRMGYFERPRRSNASEVAAELDIAPSTFAEYLAAAQTKLMDAVFADVEQRG